MSIYFRSRSYFIQLHSCNKNCICPNAQGRPSNRYVSSSILTVCFNYTLQEVALSVLCGPPCTWLRIRCFYEIFKLRLALLVNLKDGQLWFEFSRSAVLFFNGVKIQLNRSGNWGQKTAKKVLPRLRQMSLTGL